MQPTSEQHDAIYTHDRHLIVVAGAGSGKTRVLVERYLALLDVHPDWPLNALVAITFTRKAAGEMRDRVRKGLEKRFAEATNSVQSRRWADLLAAMDSARIDTIHGLCADLLRANAAEARLDPNFEVLDEADAALLRKIALDDVLASLETAPLSINGEGSGVRLVRSPLAIFDVYDEYTVRGVLDNGALMAAELPDLSDDLMTYWQNQWQQDANATLTHFARFAQEIVLDTPRGDDALSNKLQECQRHLDNFTGADASDFERRFESVQAIAGISKPPKPSKVWGEEGATVKENLVAVFDRAKAVVKMIGEPPGDLDTQAAVLLPAWYALIAQAQAAYRAAKDAQAALDFDDLEKYTALLLQNPAVAERYRGKEFKHLLVDEFQDTNQAQWQIVSALTGMNDDERFFVVGDPKQSIYAFRGADVRVFEQVRAQIISAGGTQVILAESFRTHAPLIERFNAVFEPILAPDDTSPARPYQVAFGQSMRAYRQNAPTDAAPLELLLIDKQAAKNLDAEGRRRWEARELAARLKALVDEGRPIYDRENETIRPVAYGDMALLFQSLSNVGLYEQALRGQGIPFITIAGRGYYGRQEVHDLLNLLTALHNPADDLALASALRSPLFGLSDDALYALRLTESSLWEALDQPGDLLPADEINAVAFARDALYRLHLAAGRVTISQLLRDALTTTGYLATLTGLPDGAQRRGNVEKLLDKAQSSGIVRLGAFQYYLRDLSEREIREGDAALDVEGVVRLMTVHASKGLEFPVVALVDASWKRTERGGNVLHYTDGGALACKVIDADGNSQPTYAYRRALMLDQLRLDAERRRLLYVAATRTQDCLIVSGQADVAEWTADGWLGWLLETLPAHHDPGIQVHVFDVPPSASGNAFTSTRDRDHQAESGWDLPEVRSQQPFAIPAAPPRLIFGLKIRRAAQARHLAATSIADLGGAQHAQNDRERRILRDRFKRAVLYDAPDVISAAPQRSEKVRASHVGDIVHEALRYWRFPSGEEAQIQSGENAALRDQLLSTAWELGITDSKTAEIAVWQALNLLYRFKRSALYAEIEASPEIYRELPFIYELETHIVHGIIDVLFRRPDDTWALVDYKTSAIQTSPGAKTVTLTQLQDHARRYHLQVGIYAEAARKQLGGLIPDVMIHYVRYTAITIPPADWQTALGRGLGASLAQIVEDHPTDLS